MSGSAYVSQLSFIQRSLIYHRHIKMREGKNDNPFWLEIQHLKIRINAQKLLTRTRRETFTDWNGVNWSTLLKCWILKRFVCLWNAFHAQNDRLKFISYHNYFQQRILSEIAFKLELPMKCRIERGESKGKAILNQCFQLRFSFIFSPFV